MPRHMHDTKKSGVALKLVWLERGHPRSSDVADVLSAAGFPTFGKQLQQLAKGASGMTSGDKSADSASDGERSGRMKLLIAVAGRA
ncbi:hypothetical protein DQD41_23845 [Salmonella enterica subsp. enterica]|nr:hypothetical protein [Salmonella enterica subsp. enterica serovar Kouka]